MREQNSRTHRTAKARSILITGCSSGIGLTAARLLTLRGWRVFASARRQHDVVTLKEEGFEAIQLDLDDSHSIRSAVDSVLLNTGGYLDALFNNGAFGLPGAVEDLSRDALRAQFETNLFGWLELTNLIIPVMRQQGHGRIVQNSSVLGLVSLPYRGAYNASKYALEGLTDTLRLELMGSNIHVSLIEPGPILSRFRANSLAAFKRYIDQTGSVHQVCYTGMLKRLELEGPAVPFTLPPEAVVSKLVHALESKRPKARYYVTVPTYLFGILKRLLSTRALDKILKRVQKT